MKKNFFFTFATGLILTVGLCIAPSKSAQPEGNSLATAMAMEWNATPADQARMYLRKVNLTGKVSSDLPYLDPIFEQRVGQKCLISRDQLRAYLTQTHITDWEIGGNIDLPLSSVIDEDGNQAHAKYFVIHDTSYPRYGSSFPSNMNDATWEWNRLSRWVANVTHIYVNRLGDSKTSTPLHEGMTATKLERYVMGEGRTKGLYIHVELIQPRKARSGYGRHNDVDAPDPGFTESQYKRLALIYTVASIRKGAYLIPGFHACVDAGIKYAHDDPQNFELPKFFTALNEVWKEMEAIAPSPEQR